MSEENTGTQGTETNQDPNGSETNEENTGAQGGDNSDSQDDFDDLIRQHWDDPEQLRSIAQNALNEKRKVNDQDKDKRIKTNKLREELDSSNKTIADLKAELEKAGKEKDEQFSSKLQEILDQNKDLSDRLTAMESENSTYKIKEQLAQPIKDGQVCDKIDIAFALWEKLADSEKEKGVSVFLEKQAAENPFLFKKSSKSSGSEGEKNSSTSSGAKDRKPSSDRNEYAPASAKELKTKEGRQALMEKRRKQLKSISR